MPTTTLSDGDSDSASVICIDTDDDDPAVTSNVRKEDASPSMKKGLGGEFAITERNAPKEPVEWMRATCSNQALSAEAFSRRQEEYEDEIDALGQSLSRINMDLDKKMESIRSLDVKQSSVGLYGFNLLHSLPVGEIDKKFHPQNRVPNFKSILSTIGTSLSGSSSFLHRNTKSGLPSRNLPQFERRILPLESSSIETAIEPTKVRIYPTTAEMVQPTANESVISPEPALKPLVDQFAKFILEKASKTLSPAEKRLRAKRKSYWETLLPRFNLHCKGLILEPRMVNAVQDAMSNMGNAQELLISALNFELRRHDFRTLKPGKWLNDEVINATRAIVNHRSATLLKKWNEGAPHISDETKPFSSFAFNSFFYTKLAENPVNKQTGERYDYSQVRRWTNRPIKTDIFSLDFLIVPINCGNSHWIYVMIDMVERVLTYIDSMFGYRKDVLENLLRYLQDEHMDKKGLPMPDVGEWKFRMTPKSYPRQKNAYDCGAFVCLGMEYTALGIIPVEGLHFSEKDMPQYRLRLGQEFLNLR